MFAISLPSCELPEVFENIGQLQEEYKVLFRNERSLSAAGRSLLQDLGVYVGTTVPVTGEA